MIFTRLWHYKLIPYLPKSQLLAQWRELNSIFKKQDKHILINYIYNYGKLPLYFYSLKVMEELDKRDYTIKSRDNFDKHFADVFKKDDELIFVEHNKEYLTICYYNLKEKYLRGQKDFTLDVWLKLNDFYQKEIQK